MPFSVRVDTEESAKYEVRMTKWQKDGLSGEKTAISGQVGCLPDFPGAI